MNTNLVTARVQFLDSSMSYVYYTEMKRLSLGDTVVVKTINGYALAMFLEYTHEESHTHNSYIVQKVDDSKSNRLSDQLKVERKHEEDFIDYIERVYEGLGVLIEKERRETFDNTYR